MNFAIPFVRRFKYLNEQKIEFNINFKPEMEKLNNFIQQYGSHRINLIISDSNNINYDEIFQIISSLKKMNPDSELITCLPIYIKQIEEKINKIELPHYYNEIITTWDRFQGFLTLNITDIFISGDLSFNIKIVSEKAKKYGKKLRCYCNIAQSGWLEGSSLKTFFIRPEDIELYDDYIDSMEFFIDDLKDHVKINAIYEIYTKNQYWFGKLKEIIHGYNGEQDSRLIIAKFGEQRLNCGRRCLQASPYSSSCKICDRIIELGEVLDNQNLMVTIDKQKIF